MKIENKYTPNFKAKYINSAKIGKYIKDTGTYNGEYVSFVQIENGNRNDLKALEKIARFWENDKFASNIYYAACCNYNKNSNFSNDTIYAITEQKNFFNNLESGKILGVVHLSPKGDKSTFIEHIQVKPSMIYRIKPSYKGVGTGMINSLKRMFDKISCIPLREQSVKNFYLKNGFMPSVNDEKCFVWYNA